MLGNYAWWPGLWAARGSAAAGVESIAAAAPHHRCRPRLGRGAGAARVGEPRRDHVRRPRAVAWGREAWTAARPGRRTATSWWAMALAGVTVVAAARGDRRAALAGAAATVVWGGLCLSGDKLVYAVIVAPLVAAAVAASRAARGRWRAGSPASPACWSVSGAVFARSRTAPAYVPHAYPLDTAPVRRRSAPTPAQALDAPSHRSGRAARLRRDRRRPPPTSARRRCSARCAAAPRGAARPSATSRARCWIAFWTAAALGDARPPSSSTARSRGRRAPVPRYLYALPLAGGAVLAAVVAAAARGGWRPPR